MILLLLVNLVMSCQLLTGSWVNELGSVANIRIGSGKAGYLEGDYTTAVGAATGAYPLVGTYRRGSCEATFGFSVTWDKPSARGNSTTTWSGIFLNGTLYTTWLLTSQVQSTADVWQATRIGTNVFYRTK